MNAPEVKRQIRSVSELPLALRRRSGICGQKYTPGWRRVVAHGSCPHRLAASVLIRGAGLRDRHASYAVTALGAEAGVA